VTLENPRQTTRYLAAYHEAGHAVAAFFLPLAERTTKVTIRAQDLEDGDAGAHYCTRTRPPLAGPSADPEEVRASAIVTLAGTEVDRRLTGNALTSGSADYAEVRRLLLDTLIAREIQDAVEAVTLEQSRSIGLEEIADRAADAIDDDLKRLFEGLRHEAHGLVDLRWAHVEAVARALLERGVLCGEEVCAIVESVGA
jgi:ATP-dependent Zn protease